MAKAKKNFGDFPSNENVSFSLKELCNICGVHAEYILELVNYGILQPRGKTMQVWQFSSDQLLRSKKALRMQHDLELNLAGVALALDLLEELERSRIKIKQMQQLLHILHQEFPY